MTARDNFTRLGHMRDAASQALQFMSGETRESLESNEMLQLAVVKALEIIGEAAKNVSIDCQQRYDRIPWEEMIGMRNRLVDAYFGINFDVVWRTVREDLEPLLAELEVALSAERDDDLT
ncbi:MAG: DUF86 domain-containing protein [Hormoscilla sp. SP5CHS1]|nr:DUF86 domain-containing protein [Hormoscilla sp. SP5CHS1]